MTSALKKYFARLEGENILLKPTQPLFHGLLNAKTSGSRPFYNILNEKDFTKQPNHQNKWSVEMGKSFTEQEWKRIYLNCTKTIADNYLKWF